jgi:hypothetical protein
MPGTLVIKYLARHAFLGFAPEASQDIIFKALFLPARTDVNRGRLFDD